jgi:hypothetical protein
MRALRPLVFCALFATAFSLPVQAGGVIEFTDGRFLRVAGYEIHDDWVRVDLGQRSRMLFPLAQVERIDEGAKRVFERQGTCAVHLPVSPASTTPERAAARTTVRAALEPA